ncbi:MAG: TIGR01777 family oxidoreductase [Dehalococcoidia bacterium]
MRVAITGASGLIGTALTERLESNGHEVLGMRRGSAEQGGHWDPASGWVAPDVLEGMDALVHLAGASIGTKRWTDARKRELRSSRIDTTRMLVDHLASLDAPPRTFLCASAVGYYGDREGELLTETAASGQGFLADLVRDWEAEARRAERPGTRVVMTRSGVVLARHEGAFPRMLFPFQMGVGGRIASGQQWFPWITLEDEARAFEFALTHETLSGPVNFSSPQPVTNREFTRVLGRVLGRPTLFPVPAFALKLLLGEMADDLFASQRVMPSRLMDAGFEFHHADIEDGLRAVLDRPRPSASAARGAA